MAESSHPKDPRAGKTPQATGRLARLGTRIRSFSRSPLAAFLLALPAFADEPQPAPAAAGAPAVTLTAGTWLITAQAQKEAADMIEKARVAIEAEKKSAIAELQGSVADTSIAVASKLIGSDLSDDEHRALIERYVNEAGSFNAN